MKMLVNLWRKYKEVILYVFFGGCTTLVNIVSYFIFKHIGLSVAISSVLSWAASVLFAYITNKIYVFESRQRELKAIVKELLSFTAGRVLTGVLDLIIMIVFVDKLHFNEPVIKITSNIIVIVLNYIISKFGVFKEKK